jgi:hypothetical protein
MKAMTHGSNLIYEETVNNRQSLTGLRVDMGSL